MQLMNIKNIFKWTNKKESYLLSMIGELKQDKERLQQENQELKNKLFEWIENKQSNVTLPKQKPKLTRKEKSIFEIWNKNKSMTKKQLCIRSKLKIDSLKVYISRLKSKGFELIFKEDQY